MCFERYLVIMGLMLELVICAPPPLRVTIDCGSNEDPAQYSNARSAEILRSHSHFDVNSFCHMIHQAIPKAIKNGKFVLLESDMDGQSDSQVPVAISPPSGFIPHLPKLKIPKLEIPKLNVPKLRPLHNFKAPKLGTTMSFSSLKSSIDEDSSAERMEKFKKSVQKMLHVVKVLGQIDQYLSERTRIIVDKLSKTFAE